MPVLLSSLGRQRPITVVYDGMAIEVTIQPRAINDYWLERLEALEARDREGVANLLAEALVDWDVTDDEGQPVKPTAEVLRALPVDLLTELVYAVMEAMRPKGKTSATSAAT